MERNRKRENLSLFVGKWTAWKIKEEVLMWYMWNIFNKTYKMGFIYLFIAHVLKNYIVYILTRSLDYSQAKFISGNFIHWKMCFEISK